MSFTDICLAVIAVTLWGGNFVAAKFSLAHFPPFLLTALRFVVVVAVLMPFIKRPSSADMRRIFALSVALGTLHFSLLFGSLYAGASVMTSVLVSQLGAPFACLLAWFVNGDRMDGLSIFALVLAFSGVAIIAGTPDATAHFTGFLMALFGGFAWGAATVILKRIENRNIYAILAWMALFSIPQLLLLSFIFEKNQWLTVITAPAPALLAFAYTVVLSTFVAYGLWYGLLRKYPVSKVVPFALLTPVLGIFISRFYYSDPVTLPMIAGGAVTMFGVALTILPRPRNATLPE